MARQEPSVRLFAILLAAALPVFFLSLGANSIWDANEAFYVETPRQMLLTGDYVTPSFNARPRVNKPVLNYWIVAGLYQLFGVSVTVERAGIALGALGIMAGTFLIGRALGGTAVAVVASLVVATAPRVVLFARRIFIDIYITLFMTLALACLVLAERYPDRRRLWLALMYVAVGLGMLTKGPVALVLPAMAALAWLAMERRLADLRRMMILPGAAIVLAIVAPWYAGLYARHGWEYIVTFFIDENLGRYTTDMVPGDRPVWFYLPVLFGDLFPWAPLVAIPLAAVWRWAPAPGEPAAASSIRRLLWAWIVVMVGVFSFSQSKQDLYIFPVTAAVAVLVADVLVRSWFGRVHRGVTGILGAAALLCLVAAGAVFWLFRSGYYAVAGATPVALILAGTGAAALALLVTRRHRAAVAALAAGFVVFNFVLVLVVLPDAERFKPVPPIARTFLARASPDARLTAFNMMLPSLVYYAGRPVEELESTDRAAELLASSEEVWLLTGDGEWAEIEPRAPGACLAERRHLFAFNVRLERLVRREPPDGVVLATNDCD
jgi:4-amino-4-deoxy-L-arabinose transferase-like glycosyltransferase